MPPTATTTPPTQADPKQAAGNIAQAIRERAAGKSPNAQTAAGNAAIAKDDQQKADKAQAPATAAADPNAGKEKYTVDGKDIWLTPAEARAYVQKGIAFEPRVSQLDRMQRELAAFEQTLLNDPGRIIAGLAARAKVPVSTLVEKVLSSNASDEVKEATGKWYWENVAMRHRMDPKDLAILEKDERIRQLEAQDKQKAELAVATENRNRVVKALGEVSAQIQETLKELGIQNANSAAAIRLTKEIADVMRVSYFTRQPCTAKQAAEKVRARILEYQRQFYDELDTDKLVEVLGKENAEKVRKHFLKVVQEAGKAEQENTRPAGRIPKRDERKTMNMDEFHDYLDELKRSSK